MSETIFKNDLEKMKYALQVSTIIDKTKRSREYKRPSEGRRERIAGYLIGLLAVGIMVFLAIATYHYHAGQVVRIGIGVVALGTLAAALIVADSGYKKRQEYRNNLMSQAISGSSLSEVENV